MILVLSILTLAINLIGSSITDNEKATNNGQIIYLSDYKSHSECKLRQEIYEASFALDFQRLTRLLSIYNSEFYVDNSLSLFSHVRAIRLAANSNLQEGSKIRAEVIEHLLKDALQKSKTIELFQLIEMTDGSFLLDERIMSLISDTRKLQPSLVKADASKSFSWFVRTLSPISFIFEGDLSKIPSKKWIRLGLLESYNLGDILSTFPDLLNQRNLGRYQHYLLRTGIDKVFEMIIERDGLALDSEQIWTHKIFKYIMISSNPAAVQIIKRSHASRERRNLELFSILTERPSRIINIFTKASLEMLQLIIPDILRSFQVDPLTFLCDEWNVFLNHLERKFCRISKYNKDARVIWFLLDFLKREREKTVGNYELKIENWVKIVQKYLIHFGEIVYSTKIDQRLQLLETSTWFNKFDSKIEILRLIFNGHYKRDPLVTSMVRRNWGLSAQLFEFLAFYGMEHEHLAELIVEDEVDDLFSILEAPLSQYQRLKIHYTIPILETDDLMRIFYGASVFGEPDRRVFLNLIGHARPIDMTFYGYTSLNELFKTGNGKDFSEKDLQEIQEYISTMASVLEICIKYQFYGWILEVFRWLHRVLDLQDHLLLFDPKYHSNELDLQKFHSFLLFFRHHMLSGVDLLEHVDHQKYQPLKIALLIRDQIVSRLSDFGDGIVLKRLKEIVDWMLHYLIPNVYDPHHPEIIDVILQEASQEFLHQLLMANPIFSPKLFNVEL